MSHNKFRLNVFCVLRLLSLPLIFFGGQVSAQEKAVKSEYSTTAFTLNNISERLMPIDFDGDGLKDFLVSSEATLNIFFQKNGGAKPSTTSPFNFSKPDQVINLPGKSVGWQVEITPAGSRILALVDGERVLAWQFEGRNLPEPKEILTGLRGFLPGGAYPMRFVLDVDGDGRTDLIIPGSEKLGLFLQTTPGNYADGILIDSRISIDSRLRPWRDNLQDSVGQSIRIPNVNIRDLNGDGKSDLATVSEDRLEVFLADANGRFPKTPSYLLDSNDIKERLGEFNVDDIDYSNLSGLLAYSYDFQLDDIDNDGVSDLLLREGGRVTFYAGTKTGMELEKPRQILKSAGNVMSAELRDEDEDGLNDLWLTRMEDVSVGNIFVWLALSGSVDLETFIYKNNGKQFSSRPHRKITTTIKFPSLFRSFNIVSNLLESSEEAKPVNRTVHAQLQTGKDLKDIVQLREKALAAFLNAVPEKAESDGFFIQDYSRDKDKYVVDMGAMLENPTLNASADNRAINGRQPDYQIDFNLDGFNPDLTRADIASTDLNGDGQSDFIVFTDRDEKTISGALLLSK